MTKTLLSINNDAKTKKGRKLGVLTAICFLAPARESGSNLCPHSTAGCRAACLFTAGRAATNLAIRQARIERAQWLNRDRDGFMAQLEREIGALVRRAERQGMQPAVRLNGTSDLPFERLAYTAEGIRHRTILDLFPEVQFYDYTKWPRRLRGRTPGGLLPENYQLTYSLSEDLRSAQEADAWLRANGNVAVVMRRRPKRGAYPGEPFPETFTIGEHDWPVVDGDETDVRFLDPPGTIVGLRMKGRAQDDASGFVFDPYTPVPLPVAVPVS